MIDMKKKAEDILEDYANSYSQKDLETLAKFLNKVKSEVIIDFAERVKSFLNIDQIGETEVISFEDIDNLVKEMTEGSE